MERAIVESEESGTPRQPDGAEEEKQGLSPAGPCAVATAPLFASGPSPQITTPEAPSLTPDTGAGPLPAPQPSLSEVDIWEVWRPIGIRVLGLIIRGMAQEPEPDSQTVFDSA